MAQESLRAAIGMVTQDTSLLHRSIAANIRYGRPTASDAEVEAAARKAQAHEFILGLQDWHGREGYDAHVGERGVKLSGGQRQRVRLPVILKDALILRPTRPPLPRQRGRFAIQEQPDLREGKTVIAIAHRLPPSRAWSGSSSSRPGARRAGHAELPPGRAHEKLWRHQSGDSWATM